MKMNMRDTKMKMALCALLGAWAISANASLLDVTPAGTSYTTCTPDCLSFQGRGIYFHANSDFSMARLGWVGDIAQGSYTVTISAGKDVISPLGLTLASFTQDEAAGGNTTNWFNAPFTFVAGNDYHVGLSFNSVATFSNSFEYQYWDLDTADVGFMTLMDGTSYPDGGGVSNAWLTHFLFDDSTGSTGGGNSVPEPGSMALLGLGLAATTAATRRRKAR